MVKNVKRYQKQVKREGGSLAAQESADIIPATFVLPQVSLLYRVGHLHAYVRHKFHNFPAKKWNLNIKFITFSVVIA
eukprot:1157441-Pelagomonas_calceolata.AAC.6